MVQKGLDKIKTEKEGNQMISFISDSFPNCAPFAETAVRCYLNSASPSIASSICRDSEVKLRWCVLSSICPKEGKALETCWGQVPGLKEKRVPFKCRRLYSEFDKCMAKKSQQVARVLGEEKEKP